MKRFFLLGLAFFLLASSASAYDYFLYGTFDPFPDENPPDSGTLDRMEYGVYGLQGYVGTDGVNRIIFFRHKNSTAYIYKVSIPEGMDPNTHPSNPDAPGDVALRDFTLERTFELGAIGDSCGHQCEFQVNPKNNWILFGPAQGIHKYIFDPLAYNPVGAQGNYVYDSQVAPVFPVQQVVCNYDYYGNPVYCPDVSQSLARDRFTNMWYAGTSSWNRYPGAVRRVYKYNGSSGISGSWETAFLYETPDNIGPKVHHDGMEFMNGHLYLADIFGNFLYQYTPDGALVRTYTYEPLPYELEGLGFGALKHFWAGSHHGIIYEFGGGQLQQTVKNNPPQANAGPNVTTSTEGQDSIVMAGTATDPDGNTLRYRWRMDNGAVLLDWTPVANGNAPLDMAMAPFLAAGEYTLILEVDDGKAWGSDSMILTLGNSAPHAAATGEGSYQMSVPVWLGGSVSDFDGDLLTYRWLDGGNVLGEGQIQALSGGEPVTLPSLQVNGLSIGLHMITLEVSDGLNTVTVDITVEIIDTTAPTLAPISNLMLLWPPDHKMRDIVIAANALDNSGMPVMLSVQVFSDEPEEGLGDGDMPVDWANIFINQESGVITLQLRSERSGMEDGREYTVRITAVDDSGNSTFADVRLKVPHSSPRK